MANKVINMPVGPRRKRSERRCPRSAGSVVMPPKLSEYFDSFLPRHQLEPKKVACSIAISELEKAGCRVSLGKKDFGSGEIVKLDMPREMAENLPTSKSDDFTGKLPFNSICFKVVSSDNRSEVTPNERDTLDDRKNPASLENAPDMLFVVLSSCGMGPAAREVGHTLEGAYSQTQNHREVTGVFRKSGRRSPGEAAS